MDEEGHVDVAVGQSQPGLTLVVAANTTKPIPLLQLNPWQKATMRRLQGGPGRDKCGKMKGREKG